jgi:hypothetical protein
MEISGALNQYMNICKGYCERMCFVMNQNNNQKNEELSDYITHATNTANEIFKLYGTKVALDAMAQYMVKKP